MDRTTGHEALFPGRSPGLLMEARTPLPHENKLPAMKSPFLGEVPGHMDAPEPIMLPEEDLQAPPEIAPEFDDGTLPLDLGQAYKDGLLAGATGFAQAGWDEWTLVFPDGSLSRRTFIGRRYELEHLGLEEVCPEITFAAIEIARESGKIPSLVCVQCQCEGNRNHGEDHPIFALSELERRAVAHELRSTSDEEAIR